MKIKLIASGLAALALAAASAFAEFEKVGGEIKNKSVFSVEFANGTSFFASAQKISSISFQRYLTQELEISEIDIDEDSGTLIRIYCASAVSDPVSAASNSASNLPEALKKYSDAGLGMAEKAKGKIPPQYLPKGVSTVHKSYPSTTHAKTVEFAVADPEGLLSLYTMLAKDFSGYENQQNSRRNREAAPAPATSLGGNIYREKSE